MNKLRIAILFGGCSEEHDVSVKSASEIAKQIDLCKYEPFYIGITRAGRWLACERPCPDWETDDCFPAFISPDRATHGLILTGDGGRQTLRMDAVFPVLHGKTGEDGAIQGLLELSGIPYVGCGICASALCMDKSLAYMTVRSAGIATPEFYVLPLNAPAAEDGFAYPVFVKPARSGSSFGVSKVFNKNELRAAIETAGRYDDKILIEQAISGTEIGCAVLEHDHTLITGELDQITLSHGIFRIHQETAPENGSENAAFTVPAAIPQDKQLELKETAKTIYRVLGCSGLARVDLFLCDDGSIVLNEVNTLPGFTSYSRYPRMMNAAGISVSEIIDCLISSALTGNQGPHF
ncbi:MAG: D-alanine--(R)-lactate ligase [Clostridium sp.]|nr:D-alanine--(R)-lactate ligase [Clostridium sp.]